jgi:hypothetical protein
MLRAALRRFLVILGALAAITAAISVVVGFAVGSDLSKTLAIGFYLAGAALLMGGFFVGNRGPVRASRDQAIPIIGARFVRWATREELEDTLNASGVYVSLGFALILLGVIADST